MLSDIPDKMLVQAHQLKLRISHEIVDWVQSQRDIDSHIVDTCVKSVLKTLLKEKALLEKMSKAPNRKMKPNAKTITRRGKSH